MHFLSEDSYSAVTETCQKRSSVFHDGCVTRTVNVIDTPGLFDMDTTPEDVKKEMAKCMDMARDGIHAMLMVFSATSRFSCEDEKNMVNLCANRVVLFDNNTEDMQLRQSQLKKLLDAVDFVLLRNRGRPFCNQMFTQIQEAHQVSISNKGVYDVYLTQIGKMVEEKLNSTIATLQNQIHEVKKERQEAENNLRDEIRALEEKLKKATEDGKKALKENKKLKDKLDSSNSCIIL